MNKEITKNQTVTQSNTLIESSMHLTLIEKRIINYAISLVNSLLPSEPIPRTFQISVKAYCEMYGIDNKNMYADIKNVMVKQFINRTFSYIDDRGVKIVTHWLSHVGYKDKTGLLELRFHKAVLPHLTELKKLFTSYQLQQITDLKSYYAIRIYELCIMQYNKHKRANLKKVYLKLTLDELRNKLAVEQGKHRLNVNFITYCIKQPLKEVNEKTDLRIECETIKQGRKINEVIFRIWKKLTPEQIKAKKERKQKSLSNQLAEIEQEIRLIKSNINSDCASVNQDYKSEQIELLNESIAKRDAILLKINPPKNR